MEARILRCSLIFVSLFISTGAVYQTRNFTVTAPTPDEAKKVGEAAEEYRRDLAQFWTGEPLPPWGKPCKIRVKTGSLGAGGETRFQFVGKEVLNWNMYVQGSLERILDSVLPHEVNHTIFACHYRRPLPRWADEGAATLFEHRSEQLKQLGLLNQVIKSEREFIPMNTLLQMKEYPSSTRAMLIMYAEGYALADFLVQQGGRQRYLKFLTDGERMGWSKAIRTNYHHGGVDTLEKNWKGWILAGMPRLYIPEGRSVASLTKVVSTVQGASRPTILDLYNVTPTVRLQSPDQDSPAVASSSARSTAATSRTNSDGRPNSAATHPESAQRNGLLASDGKRIRRQLSAPEPRGTSASRSPRRSPGTHAAAGHSFQPDRPQETVRSENARNASATRGRIASPNQSKPVTPGSRFVRPVKSIPVAAAERYQSTGFEEPANQESPFRKHLSRKRSVISGSIPQWAGFPGQKELF